MSHLVSLEERLREVELELARRRRGGRALHSGDVVIHRSRPNDVALNDSDTVRDDAWLVGVRNGTSTTQNITAYAVCAPAGSVSSHIVEN